MAKLKIATITFKDERGQEYSVNVEAHCAVNITSGTPQAAAQIMAAALLGGGWNAIEEFFKKA